MEGKVSGPNRVDFCSDPDPNPRSKEKKLGLDIENFSLKLSSYISFLYVVHIGILCACLNSMLEIEN